MRSACEARITHLWSLPDQSQVTHVNFLAAGAGVQHVVKRPIADVLAEQNMLGWGHGMWGTTASVSDNASLKLSWRSKITENCMALTPMPGGLPGLEVVVIKPILKGSFVVYSGLSVLMPRKDPYFAGLSKEQGYSARQYGNISRFMCHAPDADTLGKFIFCNEELKSNVAMANFGGIKLDTNCVPGGIFGLVALRDINPGERARWDYGFEHFHVMGSIPALFTNDSNQIIESTQYYCSSAALSIKFMKNIVTIPVTIKVFVEESSYSYIEPQHSGLNYDIFFNSDYLERLISADRRLLSGYSGPIELPGGDCPHIKFFTPGSVANLKHKLWLHAQAIMGDAPDLALIVPCSHILSKQLNVAVKPERLVMRYFLVSSESSAIGLSKADKLSAAGIEVIFINPDSTPGKFEMLIEENSLFGSLPSNKLTAEQASVMGLFAPTGLTVGAEAQPPRNR